MTKEQEEQILAKFRELPEEKIEAILKSELLADLKELDFSKFNRELFRNSLAPDLYREQSKNCIQVNLNFPLYPETEYNNANWVKVEKDKDGDLHVDGRRVALLSLEDDLRNLKDIQERETLDPRIGLSLLKCNMVPNWFIYKRYQKSGDDCNNITLWADTYIGFLSTTFISEDNSPHALFLQGSIWDRNLDYGTYTLYNFVGAQWRSIDLYLDRNLLEQRFGNFLVAVLTSNAPTSCRRRKKI